MLSASDEELVEDDDEEFELLLDGGALGAAFAFAARPLWVGALPPSRESKSSSVGGGALGATRLWTATSSSASVGSAQAMSTLNM